MCQGSQGRLQRQVDDCRDEQKNTGAMPFADILKPQRVQRALDDAGVHVRQCTFGPSVTFYAFLAQVLSADASCRQATCLLLAWLGIGAKENKAWFKTGHFRVTLCAPGALPPLLPRMRGKRQRRATLSCGGTGSSPASPASGDAPVRSATPRGSYRHARGVGCGRNGGG